MVSKTYLRNLLNKIAPGIYSKIYLCFLTKQQLINLIIYHEELNINSKRLDRGKYVILEMIFPEE